MGENGWDEWGKHVLAELERLDSNGQKTYELLQEIRGEVISLQIRAGLWGSLGGVVFASIVSLLVKSLSS